MEKPILFSTEMVRAILEGRKTQTRRVIKPQPEGQPTYCYAGSHRADIGKWHHGGKRYSPPCHGDDVLWVRETWLKNAPGGASKYFHKADAPDEVIGQAKAFGYRWRSSRYMPREAARIFLTVKSVRVERLQDINHPDIAAEGMGFYGEHSTPYHYGVHRTEFKHLWDSINAKRGYGWDVNPFVWVVEFEREVVTSG